MKNKYEVRVWEKRGSYKTSQSEADYQFKNLSDAKKFCLELKKDKVDAYHIGYASDENGYGWEFMEGWTNK